MINGKKGKKFSDKKNTLRLLHNSFISVVIYKPAYSKGSKKENGLKCASNSVIEGNRALN